MRVNAPIVAGDSGTREHHAYSPKSALDRRGSFGANAREAGARAVRTNQAKAALLAGEVVFGCFIRHPSASIVELLALQGWDVIVFDAEHGAIEPGDCEEMTRAALLGGATPIVRIPAADRTSVQRYLDVGALGLHAPLVETGRDAENVVRFARYMPEGERGLAGVRAASYGQAESFGEYVRRANEELLVAVQVETRQGVENIEEIVTVPGIDAVFIGTTDLAHSLGRINDPGHPDVISAIDRVAEETKSAEKALGILVPDEARAREWIARGASYICVTVEGLLGQASRVMLGALAQERKAARREPEVVERYSGGQR
jgi:4-hydroxy-2-oxoheptanedioate aldolase